MNIIQKNEKALCLRMLTALLVKNLKLAEILSSIGSGGHYINYGIGTQWSNIQTLGLQAMWLLQQAE